MQQVRRSDSGASARACEQFVRLHPGNYSCSPLLIVVVLGWSSLSLAHSRAVKMDMSVTSSLLVVLLLAVLGKLSTSSCRWHCIAIFTCTSVDDWLRVEWLEYTCVCVAAARARSHLRFAVCRCNERCATCLPLTCYTNLPSL